MKNILIMIVLVLTGILIGGFFTDFFAQEYPGISDTAKYTVYVNESPVGETVYTLEKSGLFERTFTLSMAGQTVRFKSAAFVGQDGIWDSLSIIVPTDTIKSVFEDSVWRYQVRGEEKTTPIEDSAVFYDDYAIIFETVVLSKYDFEKGGVQQIKRFVPPGTYLHVGYEFLGDTTIKVNGIPETFRQFESNIKGIKMKHHFNDEGIDVLLEVPIQYAKMIREGYEDLLREESAELISTPGFTYKKETVMVPMRDGVRLSTDIYLPESAEKLPAILLRTPYKKELMELDAQYYASRGYVTVVQDVRGRFGSEGTFTPMIHEAIDGYDAVEWIAAQQWSSGKIGMIGASYGGWVQLAAAIEKPPHLTTIIPNVAPPGPFYNIPYEYGCFFMLGSAWWAYVVVEEATADISGVKMKEISDVEYEEILSHLPVIDIDKELTGREVPFYREWIENDTFNDYYKTYSFRNNLKEVDIPVFLQSGWFDGDGIGTKLNYYALRESTSPFLKMVVGPWGHSSMSSTRYMNVEFSEESGLDMQRLYLRWFDYWLKGYDNGITQEPAVMLYDMFSNRWLEDDVYPLQKSEFKKLYIAGNGALSPKTEGVLSFTEPAEEESYDEYTYNPGEPTPTWDSRLKDEEKNFFKVTDERSDILVYESPALEEEITIAGPVEMVLYAETDVVDTDWFAVLYAVREDSALLYLAKGCIRARYRNSMEKTELLTPGKIYAYNLDLWHTGITFKPGDKIRLEIQSAYFPNFSRNLNTGGHNETEVDYQSAHQKIHHSKDYPSHLILPVIPE